MPLYFVLIHVSWEAPIKRSAKKVKGNRLSIDGLWHNHNRWECHTIVFWGILWYNCDKQEYHNFALYKRLFIGDLWHEYDQYKCQSIAQSVKYFLIIIKHLYILSRRLCSPKDSQDDKIYPEHYLNNICKYIHHHIPS